MDPEPGGFLPVWRGNVWGIKIHAVREKEDTGHIVFRKPSVGTAGKEMIRTEASVNGILL